MRWIRLSMARARSACTTRWGSGEGCVAERCCGSRSGGYSRFVVDLDPGAELLTVVVEPPEMETWLASPFALPDSESARDFERLYTEFDGVRTLEADDLAPYHAAGVEKLHLVVATPEREMERVRRDGLNAPRDRPDAAEGRADN